ncbi:DUF6745 domain-containing protein [Deinococcus lacus]|uniref:DUF6745 domain-containing protein n=1 Tax=Deinococcus lacus TaxID=392561 RepID=A0ABW1YFM0_9DEIO
MLRLTAAEALEALEQGTPGPLHFQGTLKLTKPLKLPAGLTGDILDLSESGISELPAGLKVDELRASGLPLHSIPADLQVKFRLDLSACPALTELPAGLKVGSLVLRDCPSLERLPEGLSVNFLDISGCEALREWPQHAELRYGHLLASRCASLRALPEWLTTLSGLDLSDTRGITALPPGLNITGWLDVGGSGLGGTQPAQAGATLRWRGVRVNEAIAFHPELLSGADALSEKNAERRRVILERIGLERFLSEVDAEVLDTDHDAGGERRLVRVPLPDDEPFVAVLVACPSTGRRYALRVPPHITTGHAASAWLAGFDDPGQYQPALEA